MRDERKTLDKKSENLKFKKIFKKQKWQEKGITLIALVVTIVILLILAGVTLNIALSDNGLFKKTKEATEKYQIEADREALEMLVMSYKLGENTEDESSKSGKELLDRNLKNSSTWNMIVDKSNNKTYGTGWYYIEKGEEIEGFGKAKNAYVINYETGEIIELKEDNYISLSAGDMLAVKDNLIINVDSSIIDKGVENSKEALEAQLGEGVTLEGFKFDGSSESGLTSTSFNFDGVDDYIKVEYNSEEQKKKLAENGFTFEFYGTWDNGKSYNKDKEEINGNGYSGLFCYWSGNEEDAADFRFGMARDTNNVVWNAGFYDGGYSDYNWQDNNRHNIWFPVENMEKFRTGTYMTVTLDASSFYEIRSGKFKDQQGNEMEDDKNGTFCKQKLYIDGKEVCEGDYREENWRKFVSDKIDKDNYFGIGRSTWNNKGQWHYSKIKAYCLRLYSRALNDEEVLKNYNKSVEYHSLLEESN